MQKISTMTHVFVINKDEFILSATYREGREDKLEGGECLSMHDGTEVKDRPLRTLYCR